MLLMSTHRPRNVNASRAAGILYGDWGTSKAYVIGLAFALAGYASFWPILAVSILSLFVGLNYILICKYYPNGGGVYASVRRRSQILAIAGAFFLVADYLVTAALSALSAFQYFGVSDPIVYSAFFIVLIGMFNFFGPRHTGTLAVIVTIAAVAVFTCLALLSLPFLPQGWKNLSLPPKDPLTFWTQFCSVIVALSGIETIANTTSIMRLNPRSDEKNPVVTRTSTPAILSVMSEVIIYTTLFTLAAAAIGNFHFKDHSVSAPGFADVNDYMLSYLALVFGSNILGSTLGTIFSHILKAVVGIILLSAVNTAITGLIALQYLMASDKELPNTFKKMNSFGVPFLPLFVAALIPAVLILVFKKIILLADLYAIGFVGAIATNLGATSTDLKLPLKKRERVFMFLTFLIMAAIEITLFIQKPHARYFVSAILVVGLGLRALSKWVQKKKPSIQPAKAAMIGEKKGTPLLVVSKMGKAVRKGVEEAIQNQIPLNILIVREQEIISENDLKKTGVNDLAAKPVYEYVQKKGNAELIDIYYSVTDSLVDITLAYAERLEASRVIIETPARARNLLKGNQVENLKKLLPIPLTSI